MRKILCWSDHTQFDMLHTIHVSYMLPHTGNNADFAMDSEDTRAAVF